MRSRVDFRPHLNSGMPNHGTIFPLLERLKITIRGSESRIRDLYMAVPQATSRAYRFFPFVPDENRAIQVPTPPLRRHSPTFKRRSSGMATTKRDPRAMDVVPVYADGEAWA